MTAKGYVIPQSDGSAALLWPAMPTLNERGEVNPCRTLVISRHATVRDAFAFGVLRGMDVTFSPRRPSNAQE